VLDEGQNFARPTHRLICRGYTDVVDLLVQASKPLASYQIS
jgi:hypothetical protein